MIDGWSWFRERADAELGPAPDPPEDRLVEVAGRAAKARRRRLAELGAAAGTVVVSIALIGATVALGRSDRTPAQPSLPAPAEPTAAVSDKDGPSPASVPARPQVSTGRPAASIAVRSAPVGLPSRTGYRSTPARAPVTTRASAPAAAVTTPQPPPTTPHPTPSPTPSATTPTTSPPTP